MADNNETPLEISTIADCSSLAPVCKVCANKDHNAKDVDELENKSFQNKGATLNQDTSTLDSHCSRCQDASKNNNTEIHTHSLGQSDEINTTIKNNNCPKFPVAFEVQADRKSNQTNFKPSQQKRNLQESFLHFMKKKKDVIKQERIRRSSSLGCSVSQERLDALRCKLIEQATRYIGVPYSRKYWSPDSPEYASPLFLDCCGLVRRVVRDLQEDLGFRMGPWNQAYMYDTLPVTLTVDQLKPGDLVFMTGVYNNPKSKKQLHGMVHVEIWLGDGHRTIGSRWNSGKVGIFESYKFQPKSFHSEEYIFKSIDTWLTGICHSFCSEHSWQQYKYNPSARSIFSSDGSSDGSIRDQRADFDDDTDTESPSGPPPSLGSCVSTTEELNSELGAGETSVELKPELEARGISVDLKSELRAGESSDESNLEHCTGESSVELKSELGEGETSVELNAEIGLPKNSIELKSKLSIQENSVELKLELGAGLTILDAKTGLVAEGTTLNAHRRPPENTQKLVCLASADVGKDLRGLSAEIVEENMADLSRTTCKELQDNVCSAARKDLSERLGVKPSTNESPCIKELILRFESAKKSDLEVGRKEPVDSCRLAVPSSDGAKGGRRSMTNDAASLRTDVGTLLKIDVASDMASNGDEQSSLTPAINSTVIPTCQGSGISIASTEDIITCHASSQKNGVTSNKDVLVKHEFNTEVKSNVPDFQEVLLNIDMIPNEEAASQKSMFDIDVASNEDEPASQQSVFNIDVSSQFEVRPRQGSMLNIDVTSDEYEPVCHGSLLKYYIASQEDVSSCQGSLLNIDIIPVEDEPVSQGSMLNNDVSFKEDVPVNQISLLSNDIETQEDEPASQRALLNIDVSSQFEVRPSQLSMLNIDVTSVEDVPASWGSKLNIDVSSKEDEPASQRSLLNIDVSSQFEVCPSQGSMLNIDVTSDEYEPASQGSLLNIDVISVEDEPANRGSKLNIDVSSKEHEPASQVSMLNIDVTSVEDVPANQGSMLNIDVSSKEHEPASQVSMLNIDVTTVEDVPASQVSMLSIDVTSVEDEPANEGSLCNIPVQSEKLPTTHLPLLTNDFTSDEDEPASQGSLFSIDNRFTEHAPILQGSRLNICVKSDEDIICTSLVGSWLNIDVTSDDEVPVSQGSKFNLDDTSNEDATASLAASEMTVLNNEGMSGIIGKPNTIRAAHERSLPNDELFLHCSLEYNRHVQNSGVESNIVTPDIPAGNISAPSPKYGRKSPLNNNAIFSYNVPTPQGSVLSTSSRAEPGLGTPQSSRAILYRCLPTGRGLRVGKDVSLIDDVLGNGRYILDKDVNLSDGLLASEGASLKTGDAADSTGSPDSKGKTGAKLLSCVETRESTTDVMMNGDGPACAQITSQSYVSNNPGHLQSVGTQVSFFVKGNLPSEPCRCDGEAACHRPKNSEMWGLMKNRCKKTNGQPSYSTRLRPHREYRSGALDQTKYAEERAKAGNVLVRKTAIRDSTFSVLSNSPDSADSASYALGFSHIPHKAPGISRREVDVSKTSSPGLCKLFVGWFWDMLIGLCRMLVRHFASFACFPPKLCESDDVSLDSNLMTTGMAIDDRNFAFCKMDGKQTRAVCVNGHLGDRVHCSLATGPDQGINVVSHDFGEGDGRNIVSSSRIWAQRAKPMRPGSVKPTAGSPCLGALQGNSNNNSSQVHDQGSSFQIDRMRLKMGDPLSGTSHPLPKMKNSLPPLLVNKKNLQCLRQSSAAAPKKLIQVGNLPTLPGHSTVRDIMTCGDTESSAKVDIQRPPGSIAKGGFSALSPRRQAANKLGGDTTGDSPALNKTHCEGTSADDGKDGSSGVGGKDGPRQQSGGCPQESSSGGWGPGRPCTIETLSEVVIGGVTEHMFNELMEKGRPHPSSCAAQQGVARRPRASNAQHEVTSCDNDEDSESDSDSETEDEDDEEDEEEEEEENEEGRSSPDMPPWVLRTGCLDDYLNECDAADAVDESDDDRMVAPKLVVKQIKMSVKGTGISPNGKRASALGRKAAQGKGEGAEGGESIPDKGVGDGKKAASSDKGEGAGDDSVGKGSDDSSAGGGGGGKKGGVRNSKAPTCALPTNMQPTFYVSGGNNSILRGNQVRDAHGNLRNDPGCPRSKPRNQGAPMPVRPRLTGMRPQLCLKPPEKADCAAEPLMYPRMQAYACPDRRPTFYLSHGNNSNLVEGPLLELGWKKTTDKHDERYRLKWVENRCRINYIAFREGEQLVNHIPNCKLLTNKLGLLCSLQEYERVTLLTKGRLPRLKMVDFVPETYKLDERTDRERFLNDYKDGETWICKPTSLNQGKGIFLLRSRDEINQLLSEREAKSTWSRQVQMRIVQRYIHNPLLIDGRKFDIRAYMFIASTVPFLVLFHKGYVRLSCQKYSQDDPNLTTHLTNQFVQKKDPSYKDNKEDTAWTMDKLNDYINENIGKEKNMEKDWVFGGLMKQMQRITLHCFNSVKHKLQCKIGYFDLYGMDFMVDSDLKVWLIEINANPALWTNCQALKEAIPCVVRDALYLAIESFDKSRKGQSLLPLNSLGAYNVLYCGSTPYSGQRQVRSVSPFKDSLEICRPTGTSPVPGHRNQSPPRSVPKVNNNSPYAVNPKVEKKSTFSSTVLPAINIGGTVSSVPARPGLTGGAYHSPPKRQHQSLPQQQISRVSLAGSSLSEESKVRMTHASLSSSGSKESAYNRGS